MEIYKNRSPSFSVGSSPTFYSIIYTTDTIMLKHSYFSDFDDNDVVAFDELNLHKIKKLKQVMEAMQRDQIESNKYLGKINYPK
jgi:DNA-binding protein Fis